MIRTQVEALVIALLCLHARALIVNTAVKRTFDLTKHIVVQVDEVTFKDDENDIDSYAVAVPLYLNVRLAYLTAKSDKNAPYTVVPNTVDSTHDVQLYNVKLKSPVPRGVEAYLKLTAYYTRVLTPYPAAIKQTEDQLVVFHAPHLFVTPYSTTVQTTQVKLPSSTQIESHAILQPTVVEGSLLTYGPYDTAVDAYAALESPSSLSVHFKHNGPFITMTSLVKEIEVSMWGRISTEEVVDLKHTGAALLGGFSRFDYAEKQTQSASFRTLHAFLPKEATNIYYRDEIGNVTTSTVRRRASRTELDLEARYPLFGGWKTQYYMGYAIPASSALFRQDDKFRLEMDFGSCVQDAAVDELTLKVILPEGATNIDVQLPYGASVERTTRQSYLDAPDIGRPVVIIKKSNVVPAHNAIPFTITFDFPSSNFYRKPALLIAGYFTFFVLAMVLFRLDFSLDRKTKPKNE
ncbi:hypothetical protein AeMF1_000263 [Aphanomyces euteiches]|nr:hypothetical protein AeMF1_000263 [Aphanomyces euteiches]KAH9197324.1 hypothetical protein AeNC1_000669 [Aphanomyces euteiches]